MKKLYWLLTLALFSTVIVIPGSAALMQESTPAVEATAEPEANAVEIVMAYYDALNQGMIDEAMAFIAEDAEFINPTGKYVGAGEIRESLLGLVDEGITFELGDFERVLGRVNYSYIVKQGDTLLDQGEGGLTIVQDSLIIFDGTVDTEPPISIVRSFYALINTEMIDEAMTFVSDDAEFINPTGKYVGADEIQASLMGLVADHITFELSEFQDDEGRVTYHYSVLQDDVVVDEGEGGLTIVEDGKIVFDGTEATEPQA
jgi:ketosteroid isomerase-like protein